MHFLRFLSLLVITSLFGCGSSDTLTLAPVTGTVLFKGKPLSGATVTMISEKGQMANGFTDGEGKFRMTTGGRPGVPVGLAKVGISKMAGNAASSDNKKVKPEDMMIMQKAGGGVAKDLVPKSEIPSKYSKPEESKLTAAVDKNGNKNSFEFILVE